MNGIRGKKGGGRVGHTGCGEIQGTPEEKEGQDVPMGRSSLPPLKEERLMARTVIKKKRKKTRDA